MKKLLAILLGSAMFAAAFAGLAACKPDEEEPNIKVPEITRRADTRAADAYAAYDNAGTKVGDYKTIADAINAVVEADLDFMEDDATPAAADGGYVTKKGGTRRLFQNKKGFADGNADQFWYYENGTMLEGYNCWDNTTGITTLHNTKVITHKVNSGNTSRQSWNGYGLLDENGQEINNGTLAQSWELSSTMDAGVMMFPKRKVGAAGLKYKIDLSEVKITPTYDGVKDPVYAFIGFYLWQDYYVIATGIACDTSTGQWYEFRGTSRDNSFSDVEYKMGECFMESTWNEGGYFTPNSSELEMQIQTKRMIDDTDGETYWVDDMTIAAKDGKTLNHQFDDEIVNQYFPGNSLAADNGFVFIAGLDVKNEIANGADVKNVDFFNGAKFENLCVTEAAIYFPTEEEMTDVEYSIGTIKPELRGKWNDALLANSVSSDGAYDYTILNNYACSTYTAKNGADYYDFKFDASPVAESELGGKLKTYQDTIDSLKNMTVDNVAQYTGEEGAYTLAGKMYGTDAAHTGSTLTQQYLLLLDFAPYVEAQKVYEAAMKLSDEAKAVREGFDALGNLANYTYKGWTTEETDVAGYIWSEAQKFNEINVEFKKLSEDEQGKVISLITFGESGYDAWDEFYTSVNAYLNDEAATGKSYTIAAIGMIDPATTVTYTGTEALQKLFEIAYNLRMNTFTGVPAGEEYTFDSDSTECYQKSFHVLFLMKKIEEAGVTIPDGFLNNVYAQLTSTARSQAFADDFNDYIYPVLTLAGQIYQRQQEGEFVWLDEAMAKVINDHMVGFENFSEGGFSWNYGQATKDLRDGNTYYEQYFGLPDAKAALLNEDGTEQKDDKGNVKYRGDFPGNLKYIFDVVATCDDTAELNDKGLGYKAEVTALTEDPSKQGSEQAVAVLTKIQALTALEGYEYKGWTTEEETTTGYLYTELTAFRALVAEREALPAVDKAYINYQLGTEENETFAAIYAEWVKLSAEIKAIEDTAETFWTKQFQSVEPGYDKTNVLTKTGQEVIAEIYRVVALVKAGKPIENAGYWGETGATSLVEPADTVPDATFYTAMWIARMVCFALDSEVTLPTDLTEDLTAIGYYTFYTQTYYPIMGTLRIAERIGTDEVEMMEDFTEDELAFLNEVWTAGYEQKGSLSVHWNGGQKFVAWWGDRSPRFVQDMGGTLLTTETATRVQNYVKILSDFLAENHYTIKENGWGTTSDTILGTTLSQSSLDVVGYMGNLGNITSYNYLGWEAPEGTPIAGYLLSESKYFLETVKPVVDAMTTDEKEITIALIGSTVYEGWESIATSVVALSENTTLMAVKIVGLDRENKEQKEYTIGDAIGEILTALKNAQKIETDANFASSYRLYFFLLELEAIENYEVPDGLYTVIATKEVTGGALGTNSAEFLEDMKYLRTVLKIAAMLQDTPDLQLTQEIVDMVNATMVGKTFFADNGLNWNIQTDAAKADLLYRLSDLPKYKLYYGLDTTDTLKAVINKVTTWLVSKGAKGVTYSKTAEQGGGHTPGTIDDLVFGIEAELTLPTA